MLERLTTTQMVEYLGLTLGEVIGVTRNSPMSAIVAVFPLSNKPQKRALQTEDLHQRTNQLQLDKLHRCILLSATTTLRKQIECYFQQHCKLQ